MTSTDLLTAVIDRTTAAIDLAGAEDGGSWLFARCWMRATRFEDHGRDAGDLACALADFAALPPETPGRAKLAAVLVVAQIRASRLDTADRAAAVADLAEVADADPRPLPDWPLAYATVRSMALVHRAMHGSPGFSPHAALGEIQRYAGTVGTRQPYATMIESARLAVGHLVAQQDNDLTAAAAVVEDTAALSAGLDSHADPAVRARGRILSLAISAQNAALRGDVTAALEILPKVMAEVELLPKGDPMRAEVGRMRAMMEPVMGMLRPDGPTNPSGWVVVPPAADALDGMADLAALPGQSPTERAVRLATLGTAELSLDTPEGVDQAISHLQQAVELSPEHDPRRPFYLMSLGTAHLRRTEMTGHRDDLVAGISALERARAVGDSATNAYWTLAANPLAMGYRLSGRREFGRQIALSGLRGHAWSVLLQANTGDVHTAARHAAGDALDVARWCLQDNDPAGAAAALDAGRGLILYAATQTRDVESTLLAAGEAALAQRWRQAVTTVGPADVPPDLRRQVVSVLAGIPLLPDGSMAAAPATGTAKLLDPPAAHEVRAALSTLGMDALVYLVPGDDGVGAAVVVPVDDDPSWLVLPELRSTPTEVFDEYLADTARGMADPGDPDLWRDAVRRSRGGLDRLCGWAWDAAIGPLLERHLRIPAGRPPRLVLIPIRELSRIPWHAAHPPGTGRYALQSAVFSYTPSARMLCEVAWRGGVPVSAGGLVVGDPDTGGEGRDLPAARLEALAVRDTFYPQARYVGRLADGSTSPQGAGRPAEVTAWLADQDGGAMVHLACHGILRRASGDAETAYLLLAGQERHLAAERLLDILTTRPGRDISLAVLAACTSGVSSRGHDEAFSLGTTLLAGGVRTVISAQWSVPDAPTSVLMFMVHHYLREGGLPPADALRAAQLWMIEDRRPPETMPPELRRHLDSVRPGDVGAWAGFFHAGR